MGTVPTLQSPWSHPSHILQLQLVCYFLQLTLTPCLQATLLSWQSIDRDQGGVKYSYDSAVSKQAQNLVVSGPPAEDIGFSGSATYEQPAFPHVPPFLAFAKV